MLHFLLIPSRPNDISVVNVITIRASRREQSSRPTSRTETLSHRSVISPFIAVYRPSYQSNLPRETTRASKCHVEQRKLPLLKTPQAKKTRWLRVARPDYEISSLRIFIEGNEWLTFPLQRLLFNSEIVSYWPVYPVNFINWPRFLFSREIWRVVE